MRLPGTSVVAMLSAVVMCVGATPGRARDAAFEESLERKQRALPTASYQLKSVMVIQKGRFGRDPSGAPMPAVDTALERTWRVIVDVPKGRVWLEMIDQTWSDDLRAFRPDYLLKRFDGSQLNFVRPHDRVSSPLYRPTARTPEMFIRTANINYADIMDAELAPIFWNHGVLTARRGMMPLDGTWLNSKLNLSRSAEDSSVIIVRFPGRDDADVEDVDQFTLAGKDDEFVSEWRRIRDGACRHRVTCESERVEGHLVAKRWSGFRAPNRRPEFTAELVSFVPNCKVDDALFAPDFKEGMRIVRDGNFFAVAKDEELVPIDNK